MQNHFRIWAVAVCSVLLAVGCSSHKAKPTTAASSGGTVPGSESQTAGVEGSGAYGAAVANGTGAGVEGPQAGLLKNRVIYFDFDSSEIRPDYNSIIAAHAKYLAANASIRIRIEGNTDERGSREYNIGLGERRAQAVRRALLLQGVSESQITTVSYGEERPAVTGHTEEAWAKNRRAEIVYLN